MRMPLWTEPGFYARSPCDGSAGSDPHGLRCARHTKIIAQRRCGSRRPGRAVTPGTPCYARSTRRSGGRPAHPDAEAGLGTRDLNVVGQALDDGQAELGGHRLPDGLARCVRRLAVGLPAPAVRPTAGAGGIGRAVMLHRGVRHHHLEPPVGAGQGDPDRLGGAMLLMRLDRPRACFPHRQADLVQQCLVHAAAPGHRGGYQPRRADMRRQRRKTHLNCGHRRYQRAMRYFSDFLAAIASSTLSWMPKTLVSPVIRKILRMRSWVQTRSSDPSWARTRLSPPTSTPRPVESRNSTFSMFTTSW